MKEKSQYFVVDDFFVREVRVCATVLEDPSPPLPYTLSRNKIY